MNSLENSTDMTRPKKEPAARAQESFIRIVPPVDIFENDEELLLVAEVPGANQDTIGVQLKPPHLTIEAEQMRSREQGASAPLVRFERTFRVPDGLDPERVEAKLNRGVLRIHLKKSERIKPQRIAVRGE